MGAAGPGSGAVLFTNFPFREAFVFVAWFDALVAPAGKWFGAGQTTAERVLEARDRLSLFVFAVAVLSGQDDTRWTVRIRVAVVQDGVRTLVPSGAGLIAVRFLRSTRHWWIDDACSTLAGQLVERDAMASLAGTFVTGFVATMPTAGQHLRTGLRTDVIVIDATFLVALVFGAASHPVAAFLAPRIIGTGLKLFAFHLLIHVATATLDDGGFVARWTLLQVTLGGAYVVSSGRTTVELLSTNCFTNWDRIQTGFAFSLDNCLLPARTGRDDSGRKRAFAASSKVANLRAIVVLAAELGVTNCLTAEPSLVQVVDRASHLLLLLSTVTLVLQRFLTFAARTAVTLLLAGVNFAVQRLSTCGLAENLILLAALHRFSGSSAPAASLDYRLTGRTRPRMAEQSTRVLTKLLPAAEFPARVRHIASIVLRILLLATEAVVFPGYLFRHVLARRAPPAIVRLGTAGPLGGAVQVQNVVAIRTGPNRLGWPHHIATNETLQLGGIQLPDQFLALRALGDDLRF